jgi:hypothetical protein
MATVIASGTQTATLTTEHTLATVTDPGTYQLKVDTAALVNGETLRLQVKSRVLSGGTDRLEYDAVFMHAQGEPIKSSIPVLSPFQCVFTLTQTGGTGRAFPWSVLKP